MGSQVLFIWAQRARCSGTGGRLHSLVALGDGVTVTSGGACTTLSPPPPLLPPQAASSRATPPMTPAISAILFILKSPGPHDLVTSCPPL
jgi:hypothetical protein